jgi:hypothetical protein
VTPQPSVDTPASVPVNAPAAPKWPSWFRAVDISLGLLAVTVAFLASSFVARNSDFWRHIATGRALVTGGYTLGSDPLSYTGEARPWVNFNWLAEVGMYLAYSLDSSGAVVVALKAIFFAGAFGLLFLLRKQTMPLLPWAIAILLACIGAAPFAMLRPYVLGLGCYALLLVLLFRGNWTSGKPLRMPMITGGVVVLWTNLDNFSFLAPLSVLLLAIGETIHAKIFAGRLEVPDDEDPVLKLPPTKQLWITAGVCTVAVLLNPTFLLGLTKNPGEAIAQLVPLELDWGTSAELVKDKDFKRQTYALLSTPYMNNPILGNNLPTFVSLGVVVLCAISMALGFRHGRASHVLLWISICLLGLLLHAKFIGYAMIVSGPFLAANLNGLLLTRFKRERTPETERLLVFGSVVARVVSLIVMALAVLAAFPGWLQISVPIVGYSRYVGWGTDTDVNGYRRGAEVLQEWRTAEGTKETLKSIRGVNSTPELGDYCAWFAPAEKVFINSRVTFHRSEIPDLVVIRDVLLTPPGEKTFQAINEGTFDFAKQPIQVAMRKYNASYFCVSSFRDHMSGPTINSVYYALASTTPQGPKLAEFWHLDGRFLVAGLADSDNAAVSTAMRWRPGQAIFGKPTVPDAVESEVVRGVPPLEGWAFELIQRSLPQPLESYDALTYHEVSSILQGQLENKLSAANQQARYMEQTALQHNMLVGGAGWATLTPPSELDLRMKQDDIAFALPLLTIKQAMAAITKNPNDPHGYMAQAFAYQSAFNPDLVLIPGQPSFRQTAVLTGLNRAITRYPAKEQLATSPQTTQSLLARHLLMEGYFKQNMMDAARAELLQIIDIRTASTTNAAGYDALVPDLWENTLFNIFRQDVVQQIRAQQAQLVQEFNASGGKPNQELQRKLSSFQQLGQVFQQDPYTVYVKLGMLDEKDHPKNFYKALRSGGKTNDDDMPQGNEAVQAVAVRQLKRLNELLSKPEQQMIEDIRRATPAGIPPANVFQNYVARGLPLQAMKFFNEVPENERDVSFQVMYMELLYAIGKIEQCHTEVFVAEAFDPSTQRDPGIIQRLTALRLQRELLLGDYFKADQTAMQLMQAQFAPLTEAQKLLAVTDQEITLKAAWQLLGTNPALEYNRQREELSNRLFTEANFTFRRGVMCLLRGNVQEAKRLFDLADRPQGIPLEKIGPSNSFELNVLLPKYRELIKKYAK